MPSRSLPGGNSISSINAILGTPTPVSLITVASGTVQFGYNMPTDTAVVTAANGSNTAVTLPDPFLEGYQPGDFYEVINGTSQALVIFPPSGGKINAASANSSVALPAATTTNNAAARLYVITAASGASTFTFCSG